MALTKVHNRMINGSYASVVDYGAVGDGVTDDTAAINNALQNEDSIYIPAGTYLTTGTLVLERADGQVHLLCDRKAEIRYTGTGVAFRIGDSTVTPSSKGLNYSVIDNLCIKSDTAETLLWLNGANTSFNTFNQLLLEGDFPVPSGVTHALLIEGHANYHNIFDNCKFNNCLYGVSINYNFATSTWNSAANTANANRFIAPTFSYFENLALYVGGSVGNIFDGCEFEHGSNLPAPYCVTFEKDSSAKVSTSNFLSGRFEAGSTKEVYIKDACINNYIELQVQIDIDYETAADEIDTTFVRIGGQPLIQSKTLQAQSFAHPTNGTMVFSTSSGSINLSSSDFAPPLASTEVFGLGQAGGIWANTYSALFTLKDGVTAPSTITGHAVIYVDSADGDLKIKFGDGTVKTIVVDS